MGETILIIISILVIIVGLLFSIPGLAVFSNVFPDGSSLKQIIVSISSFSLSGSNVEGTTSYIANLFKSFQALSLFISLILFIGVIYAKFKLAEVKRFKEATVNAAQKKELDNAAKIKPMEQKKWQTVLEHVSSSNPGDWRLSILEGDIILDSLLQQLGYAGETLGERLKNVPRSEMATLDSAWEAHKIRNAIAHEGSDFTLTQQEAKRVINLFEAVFKEFDFV